MAIVGPAPGSLLPRVQRPPGPMNFATPVRKGFCIYIDTICDGPIPVENDEVGLPVIYSTRAEAEREIVENTIERLQEFLIGQRDFSDATTVEEFVVEVDVQQDGSVIDRSGGHFRKNL